MMNPSLPSSSQMQGVWLPAWGQDLVACLGKWWGELGGIEKRALVKTKMEGNKVIIEVEPVKAVPHRAYTDEEIDEFLEEDRLPEAFAQEIQEKLSALRRS